MGLLDSGMLVCLGWAGFGFRVAAVALGEPILDEEEGELELEPDLKLNLVASRSLSFLLKTSAPAVPFFLSALVDFIMVESVSLSFKRHTSNNRVNVGLRIK